MVIGPMMENSLRQSLMLSQGSFSVFFTQPLSRALFILTGVVLIVPLLVKLVKKGINNTSTAAAEQK